MTINGRDVVSTPKPCHFKLALRFDKSERFKTGQLFLERITEIKSGLVGVNDNTDIRL